MSQLIYLEEQLATARAEIEYLKLLLASDLRSRIILHLERCSPSGWPRTDGSISIRITQQELADAIWAARETVSRELSAMVRHGWVIRERERNGFVVVTQSLLTAARKRRHGPGGCDE